MKKIGFLSEKMWFFKVKNQIFLLLLSEGAKIKSDWAEVLLQGAFFKSR
ncbi:MAG: hypothetical protein IJ250_05975 [Bacteroidales bacterium]|nr:hypothetical protein [Bacteroidales bacterium]